MMKYLRIVLPSLMLMLLTSAASGNDWVPLFPQDNFSQWMTQKHEAVSAPAWSIESGVVNLDRSKGRGGNILTRRMYGDFELVFEWKVVTGANNGIKYRVNDFAGRTLGCEYQVIDDHTKTNLRPKHRTASLYDVYETRPHDVLMPAGEYNRGRIIVQGNRIEHWLNGHLMVRAFVGSPEWNERISQSKFSDVEGFGVTPSGYIMITDHGSKVWYRNMFVRDLQPAFQIMPAQAFPAAGACSTYPLPAQSFGRHYFLRCRRPW